jgi:hypothetical protein
MDVLKKTEMSCLNDTIQKLLENQNQNFPDF